MVIVFGPVPSTGETIANVLIALLVIGLNFYVGYRIIGWLKGER